LQCAVLQCVAVLLCCRVCAFVPMCLRVLLVDICVASVAVCCKCTAVCCSVLQSVAVCFVAVRCSALQCVAVCCVAVLQGVSLCPRLLLIDILRNRLHVHFTQ